MKRLKTKLLYSFIIIGCFYILYIIFGNVYHSRYNLNTTSIRGKILSYSIDGDCLQLEIKAKEKMILFYTFSSIEEKEFYENSIALGDIYNFYGVLQVPSTNSNFHLFSYRKYLFSKKIYYIMQVEEFSLYKRNRNIFYTLKNNLYHLIEKRSTSSYLATFLFGDTSLMKSSTLQMFRNCGVSHLIAISGMHITLFSMALLHLLKWVRSNYVKYSFIIGILWVYAFLVGFTPSIMRAVLSFSIVSIGHLCQRRLHPLAIILWLFFFFLLYNPFYIYHTGFLFSFIVSFFLVLSQDIIKKSKCYIKKIFLISCVAFLSGIPIIATSFYEINLLSSVLNIVFVPLISFFVFPFALFSLIFPFLECIFKFSLYILQNVLEYSNAYFTWRFIVPYMNIYWIVGYYIILFLILYYKKFRYIILILLFLLLHSYRTVFEKYLIITAIDVGQGDSILIQLPHNQGNVLIDTGGKIAYGVESWRQRSTNSIASTTLIPFLKSVGVHSLDYLILSHGDYDHMGEAINLVESFKVEKVIFNCGPHNDLENELIKVLKKKNINYSSCIKELNFDSNKLYFLNTKEYDNENDNSNVIYAELNNYQFLFMGDASTVTEKEILDKYNLPNIDVLKVGHHGSRTSSSEVFVDTINPKYGVISVGKNNRYGHPNKEVLNNLNNSKIYRTDIDGSILFKIKNYKLEIKTCPP